MSGTVFASAIVSSAGTPLNLEAALAATPSTVTGPPGPPGSTVTGPSGATGPAGPAYSALTIAGLGNKAVVSDGSWNVTIGTSVATLNIRSGNTTWWWKMSSSTNK